MRDFYRPLATGSEAPAFDPGEGRPYLRPADTLESALRMFDNSGEDIIPVVDPDNVTRIIGEASQVRALSYFNKALIDVSVEEHR